MEQILNNHFRMRRVGDPDWIPAVVPGSVLSDLLASGRIPDPFYRDNEDKLYPLMQEDYEYETVFQVNEDLRSCEKIFLRAEGLDTLAEVYINGQCAGTADNMHRVWEFPVKELLNRNENHLRILFRSPLRFMEEYDQKYHLSGSKECTRGFMGLRKAHCMSGWDWGPRLSDAGVWRPLKLIGLGDARLDNVRITQRHVTEEAADREVTRVFLDLRIDIQRISDGTVHRLLREDGLEDYRFEVLIKDPEEKCIIHTVNPEAIEIPSPKLWWPRGMGEQPLYTVEVTLYRGDTILDTGKRRMGLRTFTMEMTPDDYGTSFAPCMNGRTFFAMGADYIPEDSLLTRVNKERTRRLLEDCAAANYNFIRVWGGGYYPEDDFFDLCDEMGLCVWQDFMFACAVYELTPEFEENVRAELIDNIRRLRDHASLVLWCGNNEVESTTTWWEFTKHSQSHYIRLFEQIIPSILKEEDPDTFYWPSSPSSGGGFDEPQDETRGDCHYWDVWHGGKPFTDYRNHHFRFLSEFGFQSFPEMATVRKYTEPVDRNIFSYVMEKHQRNHAANGKLMNYLEQTYLMPGSFELLLYATQLLQADAVRYGVEHFRRNRDICMGTLYWQVNDCWPVASWSSIDYYGQWKALHYAAKRFYAPILLSCEEQGTLSADPDPNAQPYIPEVSIRLNVSNETMEEQDLIIRYALREGSGNVIRSGEIQKTVPAQSAVWLEKEEFPQAEIYENYVSFEAVKERKEGADQDPMTAEEVISSGTVLFVPPKFFRFQDPHLQISRHGNELIITADAFAKAVEIYEEDCHFLLSDNVFDMNPGTRTVTILRGDPKNLKIRSVYDIR